MSYPAPTRSKSFMTHEYCRDAVCKKIFGIFPRQAKKELKISHETAQPKLSTEKMTITLEQISSLFGGPILKFLAKGSYGSVFYFRASAKYVEYLEKTVLPRAQEVVGKFSKIPIGRLSVVKFQVISGNAEKETLQKEIAIHAKLSKNTDITSEFYTAGFVGNIAWQISSYIDGETLCSKDITADMFKKIEKVVFKMWKNNVFHADLHCNNMMVTKDGSVVVIDFGRAIVLPDKYTPKSVAAFRNAKYQERVQQYADSIVLTRSKSDSNYVGSAMDRKGSIKPTAFYSSNVQALRVFYDKLEESEKKKLARLLNK